MCFSNIKSIMSSESYFNRKITVLRTKCLLTIQNSDFIKLYSSSNETFIKQKYFKASLYTVI